MLHPNAPVTTSPLWRRVAAAITDGLILTLASVLLPQFGTGLTLVYYLFGNSYGETPGKRMFALKIIDDRGERPGLRRGIARSIVTILTFIGLVLDWPLGVFVLFALAQTIGDLFAFWHTERRTIWDRLAGTRVIMRTESIERMPIL